MRYVNLPRDVANHEEMPRNQKCMQRQRKQHSDPYSRKRAAAAAQAVGPFKIPIGRKPQREAVEYDMHTICMRYAYDMRGAVGGELKRSRSSSSSDLGWVQAPLELCHDMRLELTWWEKLTMAKGNDIYKNSKGKEE